eukprot:175562_1
MNCVDTESRCVPLGFSVVPRDNGSQRPCHIFQEIRFTRPVQIDYITFRNFYCSSITVQELKQNSSDRSTQTWNVVLDRYHLMPDSHYEDRAQDTFVLKREMFSRSFNNGRIIGLKFNVMQPSPLWKQFGLKDMMFYSVQSDKDDFANSYNLKATLLERTSEENVKNFRASAQSSNISCVLTQICILQNKCADKS